MGWQRTAAAAFLFAFALAPQPGWAEEPAGEAAWAFDVRVVRVDTSAEQIESAPTWPQPAGEAGTAASWPELLAVLKRRGTTRILMDRSSTAAAGTEARVAHNRQRSALAIQSRNDPGGGTFQQALPNTEGVEVSVTPGPSARYQIDVHWIDERLVRAGEHVPAERATWQGQTPPLDRATLALRHAQQVISSQGAFVGTEIYVFLTFRRVAAR